MPDRSIVLSSFKYGLDTRRESLASLPGTLQLCQNAFINSGGEIEKRKAFVLVGQLPVGASGFRPQGLQDTDTGVMVFSDDANPGGLPTNIVWQQLSYPKVPAPGLMSLLLYSCSFNGKAFVLMNFDNELVTFVYYNGALVSQITDGVVLLHPGGGGAAETISDLSTDLAAIVNKVQGWLADANVTAGTPSTVPAIGYNESVLAGSTLIMSPIGVRFTPTIAHNNSTNGLLGARLLDQDYPGVAAQAAAAAFNLLVGTMGTVDVQAPSHADGTNVISITNGTVNFITDLATTATAIGDAVNNFSYVSGYRAIVVGTTVTVYAPSSFGNVVYNLTVITTGDITTGVGTPTRGMSLLLKPTAIGFLNPNSPANAFPPQSQNIVNDATVVGVAFETLYVTAKISVLGNSAPCTFTWKKLDGDLTNGDNKGNIIYSSDGWINVGPTSPTDIQGPTCTFQALLASIYSLRVQSNFKVIAHNGIDPDVSLSFFVRLSLSNG